MRGGHGNGRAPARRGPAIPKTTQNHKRRTTRKQHSAECGDPRNPRTRPTYSQKWTLAFDKTETRWTSALTHVRQTYYKQEKKTAISEQRNSRQESITLDRRARQIALNCGLTIRFRWLASVESADKHDLPRDQKIEPAAIRRYFSIKAVCVQWGERRTRVNTPKIRSKRTKSRRR